MANTNDDEEYELVPISPIRRVEKRMADLEQRRGGGEINKELIEMARINQEVVDDLVKTNSKMTTKIAEMIDSVEKLTDKISSFIDRVEVSGEETESTANKEEQNRKLDDKLEKLEKRMNAMILTKGPMRRMPAMPQGPMRPRPLPTM